MQLTLLLTSPRVAPGLLSWAAWSAVSSAPRRLASTPDAPLVEAVRAAGHPVEVVPSSRAADLLALARQGDVVWLASEEEALRLPAELAVEAATGPGAVRVEVLHASYDVPGSRLLDLVGVMDRLRVQCPWDREQTHRSLARYLVEETYETLEAIESGDPTDLREELGDLLLQVCFHARVAQEAGVDGFGIDDVATGIVDKLVHRHPHVFAGLVVADAEEVNANWERLKTTEKGRSSVLDGIPLAMPALALAEKLVGRAAKVGVTPASVASTASGTVASAAAGAVASAAARDLGERLLRLVVEARAAGVDPEQALRDAVRRLADAVRATEGAAAGDPRPT